MNMDSMIGKKNRKKIIEPQLAAMVDVFSLIIVFLVMGTFFGAASIEVPDNLTLPQSPTNEDLVTAPQVTISEREVKFVFLNKTVALDQLIEGGSENGKLKEQVRLAIEKMPASVRQAGTLVNVVADKNLNYKTVFSVSHWLRSSGFDSILFLSESRAAP